MKEELKNYISTLNKPKTNTANSIPMSSNTMSTPMSNTPAFSNY